MNIIAMIPARLEATRFPRKLLQDLGGKSVRQKNDGWTIVTSDGKVSAHFEHDIVVRKGRAEVLSTFEYIEEVLKTN